MAFPLIPLVIVLCPFFWAGLTMFFSKTVVQRFLSALLFNSFFFGLSEIALPVSGPYSVSARLGTAFPALNSWACLSLCSESTASQSIELGSATGSTSDEELLVEIREGRRVVSTPISNGRKNDKERWDLRWYCRHGVAPYVLRKR